MGLKHQRILRNLTVVPSTILLAGYQSKLLANVRYCLVPCYMNCFCELGLSYLYIEQQSIQNLWAKCRLYSKYSTTSGSFPLLTIQINLTYFSHYKYNKNIYKNKILNQIFNFVTYMQRFVINFLKLCII